MAGWLYGWVAVWLDGWMAEAFERLMFGCLMI